MALTIRQKADAVGTFRHLSISYMEMIARWVPTTPEMEAKILFGRHIWELAQHADALGKRTHELRAALHYTLRCADAYHQVTERVAALTASDERFNGFYRSALSDLDARYATYLEDTDLMLDEPTVRVVERIRTDLARMQAEADACEATCPGVVTEDTAFVSNLTTDFEAVAGFDFVQFRPDRETRLEIFS